MKVLDTIVVLNAVQVMNIFGRHERPSEMLLHDKAMLFDVDTPAIDPHPADNVPILANPPGRAVLPIATAVVDPLTPL